MVNEWDEGNMLILDWFKRNRRVKFNCLEWLWWL